MYKFAGYKHCVEFLQYLYPGPGKKYPADSKSDDLWHWQTNLVVDDAEAVYKKFRDGNAVFISRELIHQLDGGVSTKSFLVRDPDGHAVLIKEYVHR